MAFPTTPLPLVTDLLIDGAWTDVTADRRIEGGLSITRGRADWGSRVVASRCAQAFDNADGTYSNRNPSSPYYGLLGRNTQLRHRIRCVNATFTSTVSSAWPAADTGQTWTNSGGAGSDYSSASGVGRHVHTSVNVARASLVETNAVDQDLTVDVKWDLGSASGASVGHWVCARATDGNNYYTARLFLTTGGNLSLGLLKRVAGTLTGIDGGTVTVGTGHVGGDWWRIRISVRGNRVRCKAWLRTNAEPTSWNISVTDTSLTTGTKAILLSRLESGNTNTLNVTASWDNFERNDFRFWGECSAFAPQWDLSGNNVTVPVDAAGILQRLGRPDSPVRSPMRVAYTEANPTAYWPLEGPGNITQAPSGLSGGTPLTLSGAGLVTFAGIDGPPGSDPVMDFSSSFQVGTVMSAPMPAASGITSWRVEWSMIYKTTDAAYQVVMPGWGTDGGQISYWYTDQNAEADGGFTLHYIDEVTGNIETLEFFNEHNDGQWHLYRLDAFQDGGNIELEVYIDGVLETSSTIVTRTLTAITSFDAQAGLGSADPQETGLGHVAVWQPRVLTDTYAAFTGHTGETAAAGLARLCEDNGIAFELIGNSSDTTPCGPQRKGSLLDVLLDRAETDQGILFEPRDAFGLAYRTRVSLYNQTGPEVDYTSGVLAPPFQPVEDDQLLVNDFTAKSPRDAVGRSTIDTGPLSTQEPPNGVGRVEGSGDFNPDDDANWLPQIAAHRTALGVWDEARYPVARFEMAAPDLVANTALSAQLAALDLGDVFTVTDLPSWQPPGDAGLMVQGTTEFVGDGKDWLLSFNCVPSGPYMVGVYDDGVIRWDSDLTTTAEALDTTETGVDITYAGSSVWATTASNAAEFPFPITIGGEDMSCTASVSTGAGNYTLTCTRSTNGVVKSHASGAAVHVKYPGRYAY